VISLLFELELLGLDTLLMLEYYGCSHVLKIVRDHSGELPIQALKCDYLTKELFNLQDMLLINVLRFLNSLQLGSQNSLFLSLLLHLV
jgi:hypothetical protein